MGDLIKVQVNDEVVMPAILLTEKAKGFKLDLKSGFNVVDFVALNQGSSGQIRQRLLYMMTKENL